MRPGWIGSPSLGCCAGRGPLRVSTSGSTLLTPGDMCQTTNTAAGNASGSAATSFCNASMPPAEAPTTTTSFFAIPAVKQLACLLHQQDHALALLFAHDQRRAGDAAADLLAAAVDRIERHFLAFGVTGEHLAHRRAQLAHRQADVEVEER